MGFVIDQTFHMWFMLGLTALAVYLFVREKLPLEVTSVLLMTVLLLYGQIFAVYDDQGTNLLSAEVILSGFSNPSLIAVLALLVMGQGMIHTDSLRFLTNLFVFERKSMAVLSIIIILIFVMVLSGFMNNTPLVIIAIPVMQSLLANMKSSASRIMMPLSYVAILGGMTTLIGSSTNLLVSSTMVELGYKALGFFDFIIPGAILAGIGFIYVLLAIPFLMPKRSSIKEELVGDETEFVAELDINDDSKLIGAECVDGKFSELRDLNVRLIQRGGHLILPPFEGHKVQKGDILIVSATKNALANLLSLYPGFLLSEDEEDVIAGGAKDGEEEEGESALLKGADTRVLAQIMITPASRIIDMSLENIGLDKRFGTIVLGIQRRARVVRRRLGRIRLEAGDVLLVAGTHSRINSLRRNPDFIVLSGSKRDLQEPAMAPVAISIFVATIGAAALGYLSIPVAAFTGAVAMIAFKCLNIRQATRAIDRKIFLLVGSMLALGAALQVTGGANFISSLILDAPFADSPLLICALLFLIVAIMTNILTNNACAILFTPIAMDLASKVAVPEGFAYDLSFIYALTVVFAANCSFASPIGYQTNLLVMGPGQYKFSDFIKVGTPLVFVMWVSFILIAKFYFGLT